jgi:hypothetical protein
MAATVSNQHLYMPSRFCSNWYGGLSSLGSNVCRQLSKRAAAVAEAICGSRDVDVGPATVRGQLRDYFNKEIQLFLAGAARAESVLLDAARVREQFSQFLALPELAGDRAKLQELEEVCAQRRQIALQERLHHGLHVWLLIHIPLSVALLVLGMAHVVMSLYY